jgi:hypothetical protein
MTATNKAEGPDALALIEGIRSAIALYIHEASLDRAVGETGKIHVTFELDLNRGHVTRTKGAAWFERYITVGG